jgi:tetratricopeptide (TPR) repeat protein
MRGSLKEVPVPDVFQLLHIGKKTGKLSITNGNDFLEIFFKEGNVIYAVMINRKEKFVEYLLKEKIIDEEILKKINSLIEQGYPNAGYALLEMGFDENILKKYKEKEIIEYLREVILWEDGFFNFVPDEYPKQRPLVNIEPSFFLIESITKYDEWEKVKEIIFPLDMVLTKNYSVEVSLDEKEREIYEIIDGEKNVKEIIESSKFNIVESAEIILSLIKKGAVRKHTPFVLKEAGKEKFSEHIALGVAFLKINLFEEAEREFKRVIEVFPSEPHGYFFMGILETYRKNYEIAKKFFEKAKTFSPDNQKILHNIAFLYYKLKDYENAYKILEEIKNGDKKNLLLKGIVEYHKGEIEKAKETFKKVIKEFPDLKTPFFYLCLIYTKEKKYLNAQEILNLVERNEPENKNLLILKGMIFYLIKKYEDAIKTLNKGMTTYPDEWRFNFLMAEVYYEIGDTQHAILQYEKVVSRVSHFKSYFRLGILYLKEGMKEKALYMWKEAEKIEPDNKLLKRNILILEKGFKNGGF